MSATTEHNQIRKYILPIFLVGLIARALFLSFADKIDPSLLTLGLDHGDGYDAIALRILEHGLGEGFGAPQRPPGYPLFLSFIYLVFGHNILLVRIIQIVIGSMSCIIIYRIAELIFNRATAITAGFLAALYPLFIRNDVIVYSESLFQFLFLLSFYYYFKHVSPGKDNRSSFLAGLFTGLAIIVRGFPLVLLPFTFLHSLKLKRLLVYALPVVIIISAWVTRNLIYEDKLVVTQVNTADIIWMGNSHFNVVRFSEGDARAYAVYGDKVKDKSDRWFLEESAKFIKNNTALWLGIKWLEFKEFWKIFPAERKSLFFIYLVIPAGILGLIIGYRKEKKRTRMIIIFFIVATLFHILLTHSEFRYRVPIIDPFLIIYSAFVFDLIIVKRWKRRMG